MKVGDYCSYLSNVNRVERGKVESILGIKLNSIMQITWLLPKEFLEQSAMLKAIKWLFKQIEERVGEHIQRNKIWTYLELS